MASDVSKDASNSLSLMRTIALVLGSHIIMILIDGAPLCFGIYLTDFADELNVGLGVIGAASSLLTSVQHILSPVGAYFASKIGFRRAIVIGTLLMAFGFMLSSQVQKAWQLFVTHSIITAFGGSLVYINVITFVGLACAENHISIANGVATAGTAVGWMTIPLFINVLRGIYGWRMSLLILGAIVIHATVISLIIFKDSPVMQSKSKITERRIRTSEEQTDEDEETMGLKCEDTEKHNANFVQHTAKELIREYARLPITYPLFGFLIIVANLTFLAFAGILYHLVSSAIKTGISEPKAALLLTIYGFGNVMSRMFHGVPIKFKLIATPNLFACALTVAALSSFNLPFCKNYLSLCLVSLFIGFSIGTCIPLIFLSTREIVFIQDFPKAMGMILFTTGFAGVVGGFFTGWIYDVAGSYSIAFYIMGSILLTGCFFMSMPRVWLNYRADSKDRTIKKVNCEDIRRPSPSSDTLF